MTPTGLRWAFVLAYLGVDILYVVASRTFYAERLPGRRFPTKPDIWAVALLTYAMMGLGWWFLVAAQIRSDTPYLRVWWMAVVFAFIVHGVFNGTVYAMLESWDWSAMLRDITWGLVWISTVSLVYRWALSMIKF